MEGVCSWYWSSSPVEDYVDDAFFVGFVYGDVYGDDVYSDGPVRCVR